jgi:hypothetical protein
VGLVHLLYGEQPDPSLITVQVPTLPATLQLLQPPHAALQHTPDEQTPLLQLAPLLHGAPLSVARMHEPAAFGLHACGTIPGHSDGLVQETQPDPLQPVHPVHVPQMSGCSGVCVIASESGRAGPSTGAIGAGAAISTVFTIFPPGSATCCSVPSDAVSALASAPS